MDTYDQDQNGEDIKVSDAAVQYKPEPEPEITGPEEGKLYTYSDMCKWNDGKRYELYDGIAVVMESPSRRHQEISRELLVQLSEYLKGKQCKVYAAPFDVRLDANRKDNKVVQPDILVVCDHSKLTDAGADGAPDMTIEILSPGTAQNDRLKKLQMYEKYGVREYWIVDPDAEIVHVHTLKDGQYFVKAYGGDDSVPVGIFDDCTVNLTEVFAK